MILIPPLKRPSRCNMIAIIAAMTTKRVIGKNGKLPWKIPEEMQNFKRLTTGNTVIMGRKTFESIGRPLPNRNNLVVSSTLLPQEGIIVHKTIIESLQKAKLFQKGIFIIGGATIYQEMLPFADKMYLSYIKKDYDGDAYFPEFNEDNWTIEKRENHDEFELVIYTRK